MGRNFENQTDPSINGRHCASESELDCLMRVTPFVLGLQIVNCRVSEFDADCTNSSDETVPAGLPACNCKENCVQSLALLAGHRTFGFGKKPD